MAYIAPARQRADKSKAQLIISAAPKMCRGVVMDLWCVKRSNSKTKQRILGYRVHAFDVKSGVWIVERDVYLNSLALAHLTEWGATTLQPRWGCGVFPAMSQGSSFLATLG